MRKYKLKIKNWRCLLAALALFPLLSFGQQAGEAAAFGWRGAMIDVSRHFFPISFLEKQIDLLAARDINRLHLHLVDAGGWRMEIKRYPQLTKHTAWRTESDWDKWWFGGDRRYSEPTDPGAYGGYYTQDELRALVQYAAERGITIVPEIEMPGHSEEVIEAFPNLNCRAQAAKPVESLGESATLRHVRPLMPNKGDFCPANEEVYAFLEGVLEEVMDVFPSEYIHIGGDEAGKANWKDCERCQGLMKTLGTEKEDALQAYLIRRMTQWLNSKGRRVLAWDEVVFDGEEDKPSPVAKGNAIMVWRDLAHARRAIAKGYDVVLSPSAYCYLDYYQDAPHTQPRSIGGFLPLEKVYSFDPYEGMTEEERAHVLGVQGNLWTEYIATPEHAEYMFYPRIIALAEIGKHGSRRTPWKKFRKEMVRETQALRRSGVNAFDLKHEHGPRAESLKPVKHLARGAAVYYGKPYSPYYKAAEECTLTDGLRGSYQHGDGRWQGFVTGDCLDVTLDLGKAQHIKSVSMDFLQNSGAWIYLPKTFRLSASTDGETYTELLRRDHDRQTNVGTEFHTYRWQGDTRARFLRIEGTSTGEGEWIFTDEVVVQ